MSLDTFFQESAIKDPSWNQAMRVARATMQVPSHVSRLFRNSWQGSAEPLDFLKVMGFSRLNPVCLLRAAEFDLEQTEADGTAIERAIAYLGIRLAAIVLAVNYTTRRLIKTNKQGVSIKYLEEMMRNIEIGYKFGGRTSEIGIEGGCIVGFARSIGLGILMVSLPAEYKKFKLEKNSNGLTDADFEQQFFGCSSYQVAALALQQLGYGPEIALGVAFGLGNTLPTHMTLDRGILRWRAACQWIDTLEQGRNYPGALDVRNFFPELKPASGGDRNINLEVLYTEIAKVRNKGSSWVWHLPTSDYDSTRQLLAKD